MSFNYNEAIKAGYSNDEITQYLGGFNYKKALDSGYSQDEINAYLQAKRQPPKQNQAPQAPIMTTQPQQKNNGWLSDIQKGIKRVNKEILNPINYAIDGAVGLITGKDRNEVAKNAQTLNNKNQAQDILSSQEVLNNGTFALNAFFKDEVDKKSDLEKMRLTLINTAEKLGYSPMIAQQNDGTMRYGLKDKEGKIHDITPNFASLLKANSGEILGSLAGITAQALTKSPTTGVAVKGLMANQGARALTYSMLGSGAGAGSDNIRNTQKIDDQVQLNEVLKSTIGGASNDIMGAGAAEILGKVASPAFKAILKGTNKALDYVPIINKIRGQNFDGAMAELEAQVGGKKALQDILKQADELNARIDVGDGSFLAQTAKEKIGETSEAITKLNPQKQIAQKGLNLTQKGLNYANKALDTAQEMFLKNDEIKDAQSKILAGARANERVADIAAPALAQNAQAANNLNKIITKDTDNIYSQLAKLQGETPQETTQIAKSYEARIKAEFDEGLNTLEGAYNGVSAKISDDVSGDEFIKGINALRNNIWGGMPNTKLNNIIDTLIQNKQIDIGGVNALRKELNRLISSSNDNNVVFIAKNIKDYTESKILDDILAKLPMKQEARNLYQTMLKEYKDMKEVTSSKWYKKVADKDIGENSVNKAISKVLNENANGNTVDMFLSKLSEKEAGAVELNLISNALKQHTATMLNNGRVIDIATVTKTLKTHNFKSKDAKNFIYLLEKLNTTIGQDYKLASYLDGFKAKEKLSQGISQDPSARIYTMLANRTVKTALRLTPIIGRQPALIHHIEQGLLKAKNYDGFISHLKSVSLNPNVSSGIKSELTAFLKANQSQQNFTIVGETQGAKTDYNVKVSVDNWIKELTDINNNELTANLFILQQKHPELFKKPSDVYKMLVQIKNNPTHFFKNNRPDMALIAKILQDGSIGKLAVVKDSGKVSHITKSTKDRELKRLQNVNERELGVGSPYPTQQSSKMLPANGDGAKAHSLANNKIIPKNTPKDNIDTSDFSELELKLAKVAPTSKKILREAKDRQKTKEPNFTIGKSVTEIKVENKKGGTPSQHTGTHPASDKILGQNSLNSLEKTRQRLKSEIDTSKLNDEQRKIYDVFVGNKESAALQGKDVGDIYMLQSGSRMQGAKKITIKHAGVEKTGGVSNDELLNFMQIIRDGRLINDSFELRNERIRYAYEAQKDGVKMRVVVDEFNDGKKIFDLYTDRNFTDFSELEKSLSQKNPKFGTMLKQLKDKKAKK